MGRIDSKAALSRSSGIRIVTCNVQRASISRARRQAAWLVGVGAEVLVLTEVSADESGDVLARLLVDAGFGVLLPKPASHDRYRVLLASRDAEPTCVDVGADSMGHRCVAARVSLPAGVVGVAGLYVPSRGPRERRNQDKRAFQDRVAAILPDVEKALDVAGPVVVAGDLNVVEPAHDPRYAVFGMWEYDFYRAFGRAGFEDAFRIMEPVKMDYSWFGRPSAEGQRNGYRFDHAFVSGAHRAAVIECRYDHSVRTAGLTDHSALTLTLDVSATVE
ncbi:endonuclease/exonuclease/phosphatase family protein [Actinocrispum wychmicini]|uniref:Exodeoxyribonuclease-3 n=1 Tax=Actinocrispum wychmicini TaxID=1213861 RepID=A0A4R2IJ19_9PSEU|nr:endonuclease/exonuclease/phosphatase family protein [Actinocrispum wychmicini]TCO43798.1 exodeoxyribonuclease-3 [Actinocrispum wychmicini]